MSAVGIIIISEGPHMKIKNLLLLLLALALVLSLAACGDFDDRIVKDGSAAPAADAEAPAGEALVEAVPAEEVYYGDVAAWTVMIYLDGADLESESEMATGNLEEIANTYPNGSVNVVFQTGGCEEWHAYDSLGLDIPDDMTQRYYFGADGFELLDEFELQNMADPATLTDFISWSADCFPAEKYLLVMWDHGGGSMSGLCWDNIFGDYACLSVPEFARAIAESGVHFEAALLDVCLMATLETAQALEPYCNYLIGSEEVLAGAGSSYTDWLQYLYDEPDCTGAQLGEVACDTIQQKYVALGDTTAADWLTYSCIDLSKIDAVSDAFDDYFAEVCELLAYPIDFYNFAYSVRTAEKYYYPEMTDLIHFTQLSRTWGVSDEAVSNLINAARDAVTSNVRGNFRCYSNGLSFYYNPSETYHYLNRYSQACTSPIYLSFIDALNTGWTAPDWVYDIVPRLPELNYSDFIVKAETDVDEDGNLNMYITNARDIVATVDALVYQYSEESDEWYRLGRSGEVDGDFDTGVFSAMFNGEWLTIGDQFVELLIQEENPNNVVYNIPIYVPDEKTTYAFRAGMIYDEEADENSYGEELTEDVKGQLGYYELYGVWDWGLTSATGIPGRDVFNIDEFFGMELMPELTVVDIESGYDLSYKHVTPFTVDEFTAARLKPLPAGRYAYSFVITSVLGTETYTDPVIFDWDGKTMTFVPAEEEAAS